MAKKRKSKPWKEMTPEERKRYRDDVRFDRRVDMFFILLILAIVGCYWLGWKDSGSELSFYDYHMQKVNSLSSNRIRAKGAALPGVAVLAIIACVFRIVRSYLFALAHRLDDLPEEHCAARCWLWLKRNRGKLCLGLLALLLAGWLLKALFARMAAESGLTFFSALCQACWGFLQGAWGLIWGILQVLWGVFLFSCFVLVLKLFVTGIAALIKPIERFLKKIPIAILGMFKK